MAHTYSNLLTHAIFGTKDRLLLLDAELKSELFPYMGGIIKKLRGVPILINGPRDHVHALFVQPASLAVSEMMEKLKANSSKWVHQRWPRRRRFGWQEGYAAFSVSHSNLSRVKDYIERQEQHHRKRSFREELMAFLDKNQIPYDVRYVGPR
jgi:putative transposase